MQHLETKTARQKKQAELWKENKGLGGFKNPTAFGKTYMTLNFICKPMLEKNHLNYFIVVVHTKALKDQWQERIKRYLPEWVDRFNVDTVQGIYTRKVKLECSCLIIDELDEFFGQERRKVWDEGYIQFKFLLWLSATPEDKLGRHKAFMEKYPLLDEVSVQEALLKGWIARYREFNLGVELTPEEKQAYDDVNILFLKNFAKFDNNFDMVNRCLHKTSPDKDGRIWTAYQWACAVAAKNGWRPEYSDHVKNGFPKMFSEREKDTIEDIVANWNPGTVIGYAKNVMQYVRERTMIIYNSKAKREAVLAICKKFPDRKTIMFSQSIAFAEEVARDLNNEGIRCLTYHSKIESRPLRKNAKGEPDLFGEGDYVRNKGGQKKGEPKIFSGKVIRDLVIEAVAEGRCKHLSSGSALDKGLDIEDIELGIVTSMTHNPNQYVQRRGRTTRVNPNGDPSFVYVVNIYALGTNELGFLKSAQKDTQYVFWITSVDQITDGLVESSDTFSLDDL